MSPSPQRPCKDFGGLDASLRELDGDASDFLDRPSDQSRREVLPALRSFFGGADVFACKRMAASMANTNMTRETWRCYPCQERVSLWSSPNSFFAVSKLSSMAQW